MSSQLPQRVARYEIKERLGSGGMGVVYLATDPLLRRTVAVKVLPGEDEMLRERFAREARSAAALRHNNIVTIYDVGEDEGRPFIAMEFVDGESMAEMIRRRAPLPLPRKLQLMIELCAGLGYAHRNGIVHRDIKPANLMITSEGGLKILDFGLARVITEASLSAATGVGTLIGTPHYLAPEQIAGAGGDRASDLFAVGLVLYEFISYRKAFPGESGPAILFDIVERQPAPIRGLVRDIDEELETIVTKAVEKDRPRRYPDLGVLAADLDRVRTRLLRPADDPELSRKPRRKSSPTGTTSSGDDAGPDSSDQRLDAIALKRAAQIGEHLAAAAADLESGSHESAIEHCERVLLLDPDDERGLELLRQAHHAMEDAQADGWLSEARAKLAQGALTEAGQLIADALRLKENHADALVLQNEFKQQWRARELQAERQRAAQAALERARRNVESGALDAAMRSASEALAHDPACTDARELKTRVAARIDERKTTQPSAVHERVGGAKQPPNESSRAPDASTSSQKTVRQAVSMVPWRPNQIRAVGAACVLAAVVIFAWIALSRPPAISVVTPPPPTSPAPTAGPPVTTDSLAEQNAARYRQLLQQADERLAAADVDGAAAAVDAAAKILAGDPRIDELRKSIEAVKTASARARQRRADIDLALAQAAKIAGDSEAIARLQRELARYADAPEIIEAMAARTRARDDRIADRVRRAQSASDEDAVALLQEALAFNPARVDVRRELDRRKSAAAAAARRNPGTLTQAEVEDDVRQTLYEYQSAYASRSVDEFLKVAPFRTRADIEAEFDRFRSIQLNMEGIAITLDDSRTRASVKCTITTVFVPTAANAKPTTEKRSWQFQLAYTGGAWRITRADAR
jgi:serine/threonine-protein kinase